MTMPNFLIIGAAKAGTTALYSYLKQHPQIYMSPEKEPHFFAFEGEKLKFGGTAGDREWLNRTAITDIKTYQQQFQKVSQQIAIGEASALYLYIPKAAERIRHYIPNAKLITILRNPAQRAYSAFLFQMRDSLEPITDFTQALQEEKIRIQKNWVPIYYYQQMGFYYNQVKRYFDIFNRDQIKVYLYEDFSANPMSILQDTFQFLGVDDTFTPNVLERHNVSGIPKNKVLSNFIVNPHPIKDMFKPFLPKSLRRGLIVGLKNRRSLDKPPRMSAEVSKQLIDVYREDILKLQDLLQRDLSIWLK